MQPKKPLYAESGLGWTAFNTKWFGLVISFSFVFADEPIKANNVISNGTASNGIVRVTGNIWQTVIVVIQVLAVAAVVFAGLRYMFASADQKADIKKQLIILVIGAVLVFGASTVLGIISNVTKEVAG